MAQQATTASAEIDHQKGTLQGIVADLTLIGRELPVSSDRAAIVASTLDQLALELKEIAEVVRGST